MVGVQEEPREVGRAKLGWVKVLGTVSGSSAVRVGVDFCFSLDGDAAMWRAAVDTDTDGDGLFDAVALDLDADGLVDDVLMDLDGDDIADEAVVDHRGTDAAHFADDGSGTWAVPVDRAGQLRWFGLDGVEQAPGGVVDFDGDGQLDDTLVDSDQDGVADRVFIVDDVGTTGYADVDGDGLWDVELGDGDGDGAADTATPVQR